MPALPDEPGAFSSSGNDQLNETNKANNSFAETGKKEAEDELLANEAEQLNQNNYHDAATNQGTTEDTLDAAFQSALGITRGNNLQGSNRADFYEAPQSGKSGVQEEPDEINNQKEQSQKSSNNNE